MTKENIENIDIAKANIDFILLDAQTNHALSTEDKNELNTFLNSLLTEFNSIENAVHSTSVVNSLINLLPTNFWSDDEIISTFLKASKLLDNIIAFALEEDVWEESVNGISDFSSELNTSLQKELDILEAQKAEEKIRLENEKNKEYLVFELNSVRYTVGLNDIQEIIVFPESITKIPGTDDVVLGVTNQRGEVIPLIDMRLLFSTKSKEDIKYSKEDIVLTVKTKSGKMVGLIVDKVLTVTKINDDHISEDVPSTEIPKEYLLGLTHKSNSGNADLDSSTIVLLNVNKMLEENKLKLMVI